MASSIPTCSVCQKRLGQAAARYGNRVEGSCPYQVHETDVQANLLPGDVTCSITVILILGAMLIMYIHNAATVAIMVGLVCLFPLYKLMLIISTHRILYNHQSDELWRGQFLWNLPYAAHHDSDATVIPFPVETPPRPDLPFSIAALHADYQGDVFAEEYREDAILLLQLALINLWMQGYVRIIRTTRHVFLGSILWKTESCYLVSPGSRAYPADQGVLEKHLFELFRAERVPTQLYRVLVGRYPGPIVEMVLDDAVQSGIMKCSEKPEFFTTTKRYFVNPSRLPQYTASKAHANEMLDIVFNQYNPLFTAMKAEINSALQSSTDNDILY